MNNRSSLTSEARKWIPAAAAAGLLGVIVVVGVALRGGGNGTEEPTTLGAASVQTDSVLVIQPRRPYAAPKHTEIYLPEQVLAVFDNNEPVIIAHMASGTNEEWCDEVTISPGEYGNVDGEEPLVRGECGKSITPGGVFRFYREVEGIRQSALGGMWNPVYLNYGIAVHGAINVPLQPASHGCIRIPMSISEDFLETSELGDQVFVFDGVKEPEEYGEQLPTFNWIDPAYETTTTTSTATSTTVAPATSTTTVRPG